MNNASGAKKDSLIRQGEEVFNYLLKIIYSMRVTFVLIKTLIVRLL